MKCTTLRREQTLLKGHFTKRKPSHRLLRAWIRPRWTKECCHDNRMECEASAGPALQHRGGKFIQKATHFSEESTPHAICVQNICRHNSTSTAGTLSSSCLCAYLNSCTRWAVIRDPEAPKGWPMAMAPPLTLVFSGSRPNTFSTARYWGANASFT